MSLDLTQEFAKSGTGFVTGSICTDTSLYKTTDGKMQFIELIEKDAAFPPYPGGTGKSKTTWYRVTKASDGSKTEFTSVVVASGTA